MKKLSTKIVLILVCTFLLVSLTIRILIFAFQFTPTFEAMTSGKFFIGVMIIGFISLSLFAFAINQIIVKRIKNLNNVVLEIGKGKFEVQMEIDGHDEISSLTENINLMAKELKSNEYLSKEFAKNVSHEFKTPLSSIKGYSELIAKGSLTKAEITEYADIIIREIDRLADLSKNMLQISLLDTVNLVQKEDEFCVDEQIRNVLQLTQLEWESKNIEFDLDLEEINYKGNRELTFQIWQNLIANAIKFSKPNDSIQIRLYTRDKLYFEIQDHGVGISEEDQENIYDQFFIADKARNKSGSGLGLSITKKIVEKLGGTIRFSSQKNMGTTFYVCLESNITNPVQQIESGKF